MRNFKIGITFDINLLNNLKNNGNSGVEIHNKRHHLALHPIHLNDLNKSIKDVLNAGIAKHNKNLGGILLGYQNIKLPVDIGVINYDSCYIHMDLEADFFIFKPEIGKELQGVVNRKSKDHVGVLVYNVFNVSLPKPQTDEDWLGSSTNIGDEVLFKITYMNLSSFLPYIKGELISVTSTAAVSNVDDKNIMNNKKKFNKKINFDDEPRPEETPVLKNSTKENGYVDKLSENKHKSKKRKFDTSEEIAQEQQDLVPHTQKKKKHRNKSELEENVEEQPISTSQVQKKKHKNGSELEENVQLQQISISQVQKKKKKHQNESELEENMLEQEIPTSQVQKKKKHKNDSELEENVQENQISIPQIQKKKKHKHESELEGNLQEEQISIPQVQKKKKYKNESVLEDNAEEQRISILHLQKKEKHKNESELEENMQEQEISIPRVQKKKKHKNESALEENLQEQEISIPQVQKKKRHKNESGLEESEQEQQISVYKKHKNENEIDEDTRIQKKAKKKKEKKEKIRKEKGMNESSLTDFNLSELFNETPKYLPNIKTEIDSDENFGNNKLSKRGHSPKKSEINYRVAETLSQNNTMKLKTKKEKLKEGTSKLRQEDLYTNFSESFNDSNLSNNVPVNIKHENSNTDLESSINNSQSKKLKKRRQSFVELDNIRAGKLKIKKEKLWDDMDEIPHEDLYAKLRESFGDSNLSNNVPDDNIKYENSSNDLERFINNSQSKKSKKRRPSFVELASPNKKLKRESV